MIRCQGWLGRFVVEAARSFGKDEQRGCTGRRRRIRARMRRGDRTDRAKLERQKCLEGAGCECNANGIRIGNGDGDGDGDRLVGRWGGNGKETLTACEV